MRGSTKYVQSLVNALFGESANGNMLFCQQKFQWNLDPLIYATEIFTFKFTKVPLSL